MIIDTDVLVWYMKGDEEAYNTLDNLERITISAVTYIELVQGMRNKKELESFRKALRFWDLKVFHISEDISAKAVFFVEEYYLSHSVHLADALIGATAIAYDLPILTGNGKHYQMLKGVQIRDFRPALNS